MKYSQCIYASFEILSLPYPYEVSCIPGRLKLPCVTKDDLEVLILPPPPECWDYRTVPPSPIHDDPGSQGKHFPHWATPSCPEGPSCGFYRSRHNYSPHFTESLGRICVWKVLNEARCMIKELTADSGLRATGKPSFQCPTRQNYKLLVSNM